MYHTENTRKVMGKILGGREALKPRVRGPGERPSRGETRSSGTGGSHPGQFQEVRPISLSHYELRGARRSGPPGWSTDRAAQGVHALEWIFFQTCLQGVSLTEV